MAEEADSTSKQTIEPALKTNAPEIAMDKGTVCGSITYPWGIVKDESHSGNKGGSLKSRRQV